MKITVIVPTYRRPLSLVECLKGLAAQERKADEILIVMRESDSETLAAINSLANTVALQTLYVTETGVVAAQNRGLKESTGDIVCLTDDDSIPRPDWLAQLEKHYSEDSMIGAVGGRDVVHEDGRILDGKRDTVGKLQWFGRAVGNHHLGIGFPRQVDFLKGVNFSFRRLAADGIEFDTRLRGGGAQVHWEMAFCFSLKKRGWIIIYDPEIVVDHFPAPRHDRDQRNSFDGTAVADRAYNETVVIGEYLRPIRRMAFFAWAYLIGNRDSPGLANMFRQMLKGEPSSWNKFVCSVKGRTDALRLVS